MMKKPIYKIFAAAAVCTAVFLSANITGHAYTLHEIQVLPKDLKPGKVYLMAHHTDALKPDKREAKYGTPVVVLDVYQGDTETGMPLINPVSVDVYNILHHKVESVYSTVYNFCEVW
ncbi:MAG: hypothetical protein HUJ54_13190 [Erysipelotrichaceae bacterium]|nr:hypothetical protein [Erysipelotrichaceae bacterium]